MAKTKPFSFRINIGLYAHMKRISEGMNLSFSDIIEKALTYFRYNTKHILEFPIGDSAILQEYAVHEMYPDDSLAHLIDQGLTSQGELYWVASLIQRTYQRADSSVTAEWVSRLVNVFHSFLHDNIRNREDLMSYFLSTYPERGDTIDDKIATSLALLSKRSKVSSLYADGIMICLILVLRKGELAISEERFAGINTILTPWCFWLARRAITKEQKTLHIDATSLLHRSAPEKRDLIERESNDLYAEVHLSGAGIEPFKTEKRKFRCVFSMSNEGQPPTRIKCTAEEFYDLLKAISLIKDNRVSAQVGCWEIMKNEEQRLCTLEKSGVLQHLKKETLEDFMNLALKLYRTEDVQNDIHLELVEKYGAL